MKRVYTLYLPALMLMVLLFGCKKDPGLPDGLRLPTLTINKISELPFSNTEWKHVFGGMSEVKYIKGTSTITDSLDLAKLAAYQKTLELGTYDIQLRSKSAAIADTFVRFSAELKGLVVDKGQAISLTASTNDGLITIKKEFIKEKTVPNFTPAQAGAKSYKMGQVDGYYFIYVTAGTSGQVSFDSKATDDRITKDLSIIAANHYNLVVVTNGTSSFGVVLEKFAYQEVPVSSSTLITIEIPPQSLSSAHEFIFVIADERKILNSAKYEQGSTQMRIASKEPYSKDRLSLFLLTRPLDASLPPRVDAYMNVKRGSTWSAVHPPLLMKQYNHPLPVVLQNVPAFSMMTFSTDDQGFTVTSVPEMVSVSPYHFGFSDESEALLQVENEGKAFYNFFDIVEGSERFVIDLSLCTNPSLSKKITLPAQGQIQVYGRKDKKYKSNYFFGQKRIFGAGSYFYPNEVFEEYYTLMTYFLNGASYADSFKGPAIIETTSPMNLSFEPNGRSLANFRPTFTGEFDYYQAHFEKDKFSVDVFSPSAAVSSELIFPDLAAFTGFSEFIESILLLKHMEAFQYEGFVENKLFYKNWHSYELNGKAMSKLY